MFPRFLCFRLVNNNSVYQLPNLCKNVNRRLFSNFNKSIFNNTARVTQMNAFAKEICLPNFIEKRCKHEKRNKPNVDDDDDEKDNDNEKEDWDDDDNSLNKDSKVLKISLPSMRLDALLKSATNISRSKIEVLFYESKFRKNGKKIMKKSVRVEVGDEIDMIKNVSPNNPAHICVTRIEILDAAVKNDRFSLTIRRFKNLLVENTENYSPPQPELVD